MPTDWSGGKGNIQGRILGSRFIREIVAPVLYGKKQFDTISDLFHEKLSQGGTLVDLGAGSGYYTLKACRIHDDVSVKAVEIAEPMINHLKKNIYKEGYQNRVSIVKEDLFNNSITSESADIAMAANIFHEFDRPEIIAKEIFRLLKLNGLVIISEFMSTLFGKLVLSHHNEAVHGPFEKGELENILINQGFKKPKSIYSRSRIVVYARK